MHRNLLFSCRHIKKNLLKNKYTLTGKCEKAESILAHLMNLKYISNVTKYLDLRKNVVFGVNFLSNYVLYVKNKSLAHVSFTGRKFEFLVSLTASFKVTEHFLQFLKLLIFLVEKVNCPCKTYLQFSTFSISGKVNIQIPSFLCIVATLWITRIFAKIYNCHD